MRNSKKLISSLLVACMLFTSVSMVKAEETVKEKEFNYTFMDRGTIVATGCAVSGGAIETPTIEREGYDLSWDKDIESITTNTVINSVWTKKKFPVTFLSDGKVIKTQVVEYGDDVTLPSLYKRGYTLTWDNDGKNVTTGSAISAVWSINTYNINYELDGGINNPENPATYVYGTDVTFKDPVKRGYLFKNWTNASTNGAIATGSSIVKLAPLSVGDQTIKANWTKVKVPKVKVAKVKRSKNNKKIYVKYKQVKNVKKYVVEISTKKNFKNAKKKITKKTSITFTKLKKNKKYYVRVRTFKKDSMKKNVYGKWTVKTVKSVKK